MNNDIFCKLLYLDNIEEFHKFISKIANIFIIIIFYFKIRF